METGRYNGFYQFNNKKIGELRGFEKTYFTIQITDSDGHSFSGWVEDDIASGGMEGRGQISGKLYSDGIVFVKNMPYYGILTKNSELGKYETKIDKKKAHKPIEYNGIESESNCYTGKWTFKNGVLIQISMWLLGVNLGGTWEMKKEK